MKTKLESYLEAAAWASTDDDGEPLDSYQFSEAAKAKMREDLTNFCAEITPEMEENYKSHGGTPEQFAHDFWLTRNGHGAGFWDRGFGEIGEKLTKMAKIHGEVNLYLNPETYEIEIM